MKIARQCSECGNTFFRYPSQLKQQNAGKYCSVQCIGRVRGRRGGQAAHKRAKLRRSTLDQPDEHRLLPLAGGGSTLISHEDSDLDAFNWYQNSLKYVMRHDSRATNGARKVRIHRLIVERMTGRILSPDEEVDHINGNPLDNRRENLRIATHSQNQKNQKSSSLIGYLGVKLEKRSERYRARINSDGVYFGIGTFDTANEAAWMRDQWALELHGEFARLNFNYIEMK